MSKPTQISAQVSPTTKEKLTKFVQSQGLKQNFVVEQALLFFMEARRALPDDAFIPTKLVLGNEDFEKVVDLIESPPSPTPALKRLLIED